MKNTLLGRAVIAGVIGGIVVDLFLILTKQAPFPGVYQFIASGIVGKDAFASDSYIWLGIAIHFLISIVSALAYVYIGNALHLLSRWLLGGAILGVVVMIVLQVLLISRQLAPVPDATHIVLSLIAHIVFFGWPIAWYIARTASPRPANA
jgi:hypothetical protein